MKKVIAVDGPAKSGKTEAARGLAAIFGFGYASTGTLYRAVGFLVLQQLRFRLPTDLAELTPEQRERIVGLAKIVVAWRTFKLGWEEGRASVYVDGENYTAFVMSDQVAMVASLCSAIEEVREALLESQRCLAEEHDIVLDGRDIGTVVFPKAPVKLFLTASSEIRAQRRLVELGQNPYDPGLLAAMIQEIEQRDHADSTRALAPLRPAEDAIVVDTTQMSISQMLKHLSGIAKQKLNP